MPILWAYKHYTNDNYARRIAYGKLAVTINAKFNTKFTGKGLSREIIKIRSTYKRVMRRKRDEPGFQPKMWYLPLLHFIERTPADTEDIIPVSILNQLSESLNNFFTTGCNGST